MRQKGETLGSKKPKKEVKAAETNGTDNSINDVEMKHQGKKQSRSAKSKKNKGKELEKREARLEELREKLRKKLEDMKAAKKNSGAAIPTQEEKRLRRKQGKLNAKLKKKGSGQSNNFHKEDKALEAAQGLRSPPQNKIVNQNGQPVKSKFDFSVISFDNNHSNREEKSHTSDLHGRDYKRLLEKVEKRQEKVGQLKEKDPEAGRRLEEKFQWQSMMSKARGEKVKDDPTLLKKAAKRKEKIKEKKGKKWEARKIATQDMQHKKQEKRQANIDKRRDASKEKKRKKMIKKGRIIPGF
ncbi:surfeit locus protein 6 [Plakobranchus ocellatus]|uniref:Surfeit locus protein 6 n=1 Tax=Plakobranchus ocellatus TaxID=259542 RepID=A0AAV4DY85_9GAST|nr:surfeit locus protein 6 [Plakobranchus ocellatus]